MEGVSAEAWVSDLSKGTIVGVAIHQTERKGRLRRDDGFRFKQGALEILTSPETVSRGKRGAEERYGITQGEQLVGREG